MVDSELALLQFNIPLTCMPEFLISNCKLHFSVCQCALQSRKVNCVHENPLTLVGTWTHSKIVSHISQFWHFSGASSTHKSSRGLLPFSEPVPVVLINHRLPDSDQSQFRLFWPIKDDKTRKPYKRVPRRPESVSDSTSTAEEVLATRYHYKNYSLYNQATEINSITVGVLCR